MTSALPVDASLPAFPHRRGLDALDDGHDYWIDDVRGAIPASFRGTLFRNGPGRNEIGGKRFGHWFDGDGMVSRISFVDGRVHYLNRFIRTRKYVDETAAQRIVHRGFGTQRPGGMFANFLRPPENPANTGLILHGGKFLALWEGGHPYELDPRTLETKGEYHYHGGLKKLWPFSAHGKVDPKTGDYINFGVQPVPNQLNVYRVSPQGNIVATGHFPLSRPVFLHDFAMTENHAVFFISSVVMRGMWRFLAGFRTIGDCLDFDAKLPMRVLVVDLRDMRLVLDAEVPPATAIHCGNAFEKDGRIVAEVTHYPDFSANDALRNMWDVENAPSGDMFRYTIDVNAKTVSEEKIPGLLPVDFPMWDWRRTGQYTRYAWYASLADNGTRQFFNALQKYDRETGDVQVHDFGAGRFAMEPVHMPLHANAAEDEGFIATLVYDVRKDSTDVVLLDAADITKTVAVAPLRHHVPFGFHGLFVPQTFT